MEGSLKPGILQVRGLNKAWKEKLIYNDFSIDFPVGQITSILGPSGCGKTTLLNILGGNLVPEKCLKNDFSNKSTSVIFQDSRLLPWLTASENIEFVLNDRVSEAKSRELSAKYLELTGLTEFKDYFPSKLSGGMKQRVAMARAFAFPSEIILMDEPFRALDVKTKDNMMLEFFRVWEKDKRTVVFVTHDINEALSLGSLIYVFSQPVVSVAGTLINDEKADKNELNRKILELL